jgi:deoxyribodipyrimidine photo-lyase
VQIDLRRNLAIDRTSSLRRDFTDRQDLIHYLKQEFPDIAAQGTEVSDTVGGRMAADMTLTQIHPTSYGQTRNYLDGAVTHLSPYIRHGVLSLKEVRDFVASQIQSWSEGEKLLTELAWRDYWQRLYVQLGDRIWQDIEPYKTGWRAHDYSDTFPPDMAAATTGLACMDGFSQELRQTGYLHNHARMWVAAYIVHWCRVKWQVGGAWFLQHLLDGDPASNNLSWQWVASTFSHKPYFFNRANLERYSHDQYCPTCACQHRCPFQGSYEDLAAQLFPQAHSSQFQRPPASQQLGSKKRK